MMLHLDHQAKRTRPATANLTNTITTTTTTSSKSIHNA
jgi:hypothetical protein